MKNGAQVPPVDMIRIIDWHNLSLDYVIKRMKTKKISKLNTLLFLIAFLVLISSPFSAAAQVTKEEIISLVNQERENEGLTPLVENEILDQAASLKATDMIGNNYFAHTSPGGVNPWHWFEQANYPYKYAGENLAMDFSSASSVMKAWMKSPSHRENILSPKYKEIGIAISSGIIEQKETLVAVQLFGTRLSDEVEVSSLMSQEKQLNKEGSENPKIIIEEAFAKPWMETNDDEVLVYAKITGQAQSVEIVVGDKTHKLLQHEDGIYMGLFSLEGVNLQQDQIIIEANDEKQQKVSYQIPKTNYSSYFEKKETVQQGGQSEVVQNETENAYMWKNFMKQNIFLAVALLLFMVMIGNVWILEKEEQQLIENLRAV